MQGDDDPIFYDTIKESDNNTMYLAASDSPDSDIPIMMFAQGGNDGGSNGDGGGGRIDRIFSNWLLKRIRENNELVPVIKTVYQWNITKGGRIISVWSESKHTFCNSILLIKVS